MKYAIVTVPAAPVRKKANHRSEMSNQLLFGEGVKILKRKKEKWLKVKSLYDGYTGWLTHHLVTFTTEEIAQQPLTKITNDFLSTITIKGTIMNIPAGAHLFQLSKKRGGIDGFEYEYNGAITEPQKIKSKSETLMANAEKWLNAPYLWGGKTVLGVDCSGFAQTMYRLVGVPIPRDAWQQARVGEVVKNLADARAGDLAFFNEKNEISHVGILLGDGKIIHSSGKVRIDFIDEQGITNSDTGERTHHLKLIKRFLQ
jgi:cell wall-associated NlpC family hydrolase